MIWVHYDTENGSGRSESLSGYNGQVDLHTFQCTDLKLQVLGVIRLAEKQYKY